MTVETVEKYREQFIEFAIANEVLLFGEFELKSGRVSPYFFNAGKFDSGEALSRVGTFYAQALVSSGVAFDMLFGPAYKGIPLAAATAIALAREHGIDVPYAFNRKEAKQHGEGGDLVGAPPEGRVMIVDDVITAGTAIREVMDILSRSTAQVVGALVAIDRQERGNAELSAIQEIERDYGVPVVSVVRLDDIITFIEDKRDYREELDRIQRYRESFGVAA